MPLVSHTRAHEVNGKERRNAQAERKLQRFRNRHAEMMPLIERPQGQGEVYKQGAVKSGRP